MDLEIALRRLAVATLGLALAAVACGPAAAGPPCPPQPVATGERLDVLSEAAALRRVVRVLAIGSSSTEGVGASAPAFAYPARLEARLATLWPHASVSVVNAGKGGETIDETLTRLDGLMRGPAFDLVVWQLGANDALRGGDLAPFRAAARRGLAMIRAAGADAVLLDAQYFPAIKNPGNYERFVAAVGEEGASAGAPVFPRYRWMRDWPDLEAVTSNVLLGADKFHMGDRGYQCLADAMGDMIADLAAPRPPAGLLAKRPAPPRRP